MREVDLHGVMLRWLGDPGERERWLAKRQVGGRSCCGRGRLRNVFAVFGGGGAACCVCAFVGATGEPYLVDQHGECGKDEDAECGQAPAPSPTRGERAPATAVAGGEEGRGAHPRGGLRSAPTMPIASSTTIRIESRLAAVIPPCLMMTVVVRKAKPAMKTSAAPSTSRRVIWEFSQMGPRLLVHRQRRLGRGGRSAFAFDEQPDDEQPEGEAADVGEVGDAFAAGGPGEAGGT